MLADAGYCSDENLAAIATTGIDAYISTRKQKHGERPGSCPRGPLPKTATRVERMTRKLLTKAGAAVYARRKTMVEPVLGQIKQARGFRQFLLRGVAKVQGEWALVCTPTAHQVTLGCLASALLSTTAAPTRSSCSTCRVSRGKRSRQLKCRRQLKMELLQLLLR